MQRFIWLACLGCWVLLLASCGSRNREESLSNLPVYQTANFQYSLGEKLNYKVNLGLIHAGNLSLEVGKDCDTVAGKICLPIHASANTLSGIKWITKIKHDWHSWIDTGSGNTVKMQREARENGYRSKEEVDFYTDANAVFQKDLDEPTKTPFRAERRNRQQSDLVNLIWKLRYTPFEKMEVGEEVKYSAFFDKNWYYFEVKYQGIRELKWNGKKHKVFELVPQGTAAKFLKGEEPAVIYLETNSARRPLEITLATYFGKVAMVLK